MIPSNLNTINNNVLTTVFLLRLDVLFAIATY